MIDLDPVILGHNQFIGVSHLSQEAGRSRAERFSDMHKVGDVIKTCLELGVKSMMLSTHPRARDILEFLDAEGLSGELSLYPLLPYAQGYVRKLNELGMAGLTKDIFKSASIRQKFDIAVKGGVGYIRKDFNKLISTFIDIEMLTFKGFKVKAVFLHDALVDLALALGARDQLEFFIEYIKKKHGAVGAFETMNFDRFIRSFETWGIQRPLVMAPFNKVGYQMNPSRSQCEETLRGCDADVIAMSTLAAGYLKPREAYQYLFSLPNINSVVVGFSTREHARETIKIIEEYR